MHFILDTYEIYFNVYIFICLLYKIYLYRCGFLTPPVDGALLRAAFVASCLRGAFPPVDLRAVCLVRAIVYSKTTQTRLIK